MFDRVVLCSEGSEIYTGLRNHTFQLQDSSVVVKIYRYTATLPENLADLNYVSNVQHMPSEEVVTLNSKHSMLSELHVIAWGVDEYPTNFKGHHVVVIVGGKCLACAYASEDLVPDDKLHITFDFEETNGVLNAKADFDGNITQGILDEILSPVAKTGSYNDLSNKPSIPDAANDSTVTVYAGASISNNVATGGTEIGSFTVNQASNSFINLGAAAAKAVDSSIGVSESSNLPTTDAVKAYVQDKTISFKKHSGDENAFDFFTTNTSSNKTIVLGYGDAADKGVDTSIGDSSSSNLPTTDAVKGYINSQNFAVKGTNDIPTVNNNQITIKKNSADTSNPFSFTLNQSSDAELNLGLGSAAFKSVDSSITDGSTQGDVPSSDAVKSYISGKGFATASSVKDSTVTVRRNSSHINPPTFTLNQASDATVDLGLGAASEKGVDTSIGDSSSSNLPTSDAVKSYISGQGFALAANVPDSTSDLTNDSGFITSSDISGLADDDDVPKYASYNSTSKMIYFKHASSDTDSNALFSLDATAFIKDGMVSNVEISNSNLVISFNTDAEKEDISIPLSDIFNPNNYYTSSQTDTAISDAITALNLGGAAQKGVDSSIGTSSSDNLPTSDAVKSYVTGLGYATTGQLPTVNNSTITIKKNSSDTTSPFSFTLNQASGDELNLGLGDAAFKAVNTSITDGSTQSEVPTSDAVKSYVSGKNYITSSSVGTANLKIYKGASDAGSADFTFNANQSGSDVSVTLGMGTAAAKDVETALTSSSDTAVPTSKAVATYISGLGYASSSSIGNGELKIKKHTSDTSAISTGFTANASSDHTVDLALGSAADKSVDSAITVTDAGTAQATAGDNLPTSEAVRAFVEGKGYVTSVSNEQIALCYTDPSKGPNQTSYFGGSNNPSIFTLNGISHIIKFGEAASREVVYLSGSDTIDTVTGQDTCLITLGQAKTLASNASEVKTVAPSDAPMTSGAQTGEGIEIPVGAMVWLALNFSGNVGIMDFTTVFSNGEGGTPILSGNGSNAEVIAYMAQIRDNAGDFYALENQKLKAGQKFRTMNCMDSSGMAVPAYGFALCVRLPDDNAGSGT